MKRYSLFFLTLCFMGSILAPDTVAMDSNVKYLERRGNINFTKKPDTIHELDLGSLSQGSSSQKPNAYVYENADGDTVIQWQGDKLPKNRFLTTQLVGGFVKEAAKVEGKTKSDKFCNCFLSTGKYTLFTTIAVGALVILNKCGVIGTLAGS